MADEFRELLKYEWSGSSPLSVMRKCGQCPWCAELEINGHDQDCAFMRPEIDLEQIKEDVRRAVWSTAREIQSMGEISEMCNCDTPPYGVLMCPGCGKPI